MQGFLHQQYLCVSLYSVGSHNSANPEREMAGLAKLEPWGNLNTPFNLETIFMRTGHENSKVDLDFFLAKSQDSNSRRFGKQKIATGDFQEC